jgi:hypothetical protein
MRYGGSTSRLWGMSQPASASWLKDLAPALGRGNAKGEEQLPKSYAFPAGAEFPACACIIRWRKSEAKSIGSRSSGG